MMLASPLLPPASFSPKVPSSTQEDALSFRPARDVEAFNSLLPPPIEFVEGSSSGTLAVPEGKYQPINASPKLAREKINPTPLPPASPVTSSIKKAAVSQSPTVAVDLSWPESCDHACGLYNTGNTCFLNSALQCLLHTPPLLRQVFSHNKDKCRTGDKFCMICAFRQVTVQAHKASSPFSPSPVSSRLQTIAKHMRRGRQEDSHEFLRYAIDAMQKSCLSGVPPKAEAKLGELTWVHKIFGGRLRSRVSCHNCGHNSDTFDRILDLSLDIIRADSLKDALRSFISPDFLKGADKYKCEKCKKHVNAEKRFTIHEAPSVLTVHLKRFSPLGRKIGHHVGYDEHLNLQPYMSKGQYGFTYSLYGVICHAGGGPNSGHYFAFVKSRSGRWYEMNDEMVSPLSGPPVSKKTAYILFYIRDKGQGLQAVIKGHGEEVNGVYKEKEKDKDKEGGGLLAGMKKRRERDEDGTTNKAEEEDLGEKVGSPPAKFIGPLLPSPMDRSSGSPTKKVKMNHTFASVEEVKKEKKTDPQAEKVKRKIETAKASKEAKARSALALLEGYDSSDESSDGGENMVMNGKPKHAGKARVLVESDDDGEALSDKAEDLEPKPPSSPISQFSGKQVSSPVSANNFYGPTRSSGKKGFTPHSNGNISSMASKSRSSDGEDEPSPDKGSQQRQDHSRQKRRMSMGSPGKKHNRVVINPYDLIGSQAGSGGGRINTYGKRSKWKKPRARGL